MRDWEPARLEQYRDDINNICECMEDPWTAQIDSVEGQTHSIIQASVEKVSLYLKNIDMLWQLGVNPKTQIE
ncbi:hypothetical protein LFL97_34565 [Burkholderia sp. JSH-S8]|nr:hypothetical protein LFL97_24065 [Burkholderia sp. JSH-S8]WGS46163.1 hypothetical protein LFL97_34565 [Burkholderia sp. JSH-S8]